jgi:8-oxo-dGTP pyrophosphatase MutT (NUDIX family)
VRVLPERIEFRARALARGLPDWVPPVARPAATVALVRDSIDGLQTYVMRRAMTMAFAPGMYVFPGGRVDDRDFHPRPWTMTDWSQLAGGMSAGVAEAQALVACALRELHEETGVAVMADGPVDPMRIPLIDHWVTPEVEEHRYDVRFFLAELPEHQSARDVSSEADRVEWVRPGAAIDRFRAGGMPMLPPTIAVLSLLAQYETADAALAELPTRTIRPLLPRAIVDAEDAVRWSLVDDRTGEVIRAAHEMPHAWEARGVRE